MLTSDKGFSYAGDHEHLINHDNPANNPIF